MTKPVITTRAVKGSALSWTEGDTNLENLRDATITVSDGTNTKAIDLNGTIQFTGGTNVTTSVNSTTGEVTINATASGGASDLNGLSDVTLGTPVTGEVLQYDGTAWIDVAPSTLTVGTADVSTNINITSINGNTSDTAMYVTLVPSAVTGSQSLHLDTTLSYNASTNTLTTTNFSGAFSGALNGSVGATTPNIGKFTGLQFTYLTEPPYALTYASTLTPTLANGSVQKVTLTGPVTISAFSSANAGVSMTLILQQDATGGRTLTSTMKFAGGVKTLSTAANAIDIMSIYYDGTNYYASLAKGFA